MKVPLKATFLVTAAAILTLSGCGGASKSSIENAIDKYAQKEGLPGSFCSLIDKKDPGYDQNLLKAGYLEQHGNRVAVTELGRTKFQDYDKNSYMMCLLDAKVDKITSIDDKNPTKMPNGDEIFKVGVIIKLTISEIGKTLAPIAASAEGKSVDEVINAYYGRIGDGKGTYDQWIKMKKTPEGKVSVFDASL